MSRVRLQPFFGIPDRPKGARHDGADCYGIARLVYREILGVDLPNYTGEYVDDRIEGEVAAIINREKSRLWRKVETPEFLDLGLFRIGEHDSHIGIYAEPGWMLHTVLGDVSKFARYDRLPWRTQLVGFYRFNR